MSGPRRLVAETLGLPVTWSAPYLPLAEARRVYGRPLVIERDATTGEFVAAPSPSNQWWRRRRLAALAAQSTDLERRKRRARALGVPV